MGAFISCNNNPSSSGKTSLSASEFSTKINQTEGAQIVDVRTPGEFGGGHLENALNIDWNGSEFESQLATLNKNAPVFVYCLSGSRSRRAAKEMRKAGFQEVYEMSGGMMDWRSNEMPEVSKKGSANSMTVQAYETLLNTDKLVLVDFYADWCAPCKKMEPYLKKIAEEQADQVTLLRIDADAHPDLCKALKVSGLPVLKLYRKQQLLWESVGFTEEAQIRAQLELAKKN